MREHFLLSRTRYAWDHWQYACGLAERMWYACRGQNSIKQSASKVLASALAPVVQPAEFVAAPKQPLPESAPAPEVAAGAAMAGQGLPLPSGPALAPGDSAYEQLVAEGKAQQVPLFPHLRAFACS